MFPSPQIALVTASQMPKPDSETHLLVGALEALNVSTAIVAWDRPTDWSAIPLVVLRTPWGYFRQIDEFLSWARAVNRVTRLLNPYTIVRWNAHKSYLLDLQRKGVPVVPTRLLSAGDDRNSLRDIYSGEIVVKPAIGAGAFGAMKGGMAEARLVSHIEVLLSAGEVLIQPFVPGIAVTGELSLIFFKGVFSHAVRKLPAKGDFRVQDRHGGTVSNNQPVRLEMESALAALAAAPGATSYARVDLVNWLGSPAVMELELIEPELFLRYDPSANAVFARVLRAELIKAQH
jgi:glutathione synthase/RimK-type ligase-like ATP-grasp enzyme